MKGTPAVTWAVTGSLVVALAACSSTTPELPDYTGTPSGPSTSTGGGAAPTDRPTTTTPKPTAGDAPTRMTVENLPLPGSVSVVTKPVTDAWFGYWVYLAVALTSPAATASVTDVGSVASGDAARDALSQITDLRTSKEHIVGPMEVGVSKASISGGSGTVCSTIKDLTYSLDEKGAVTQAQQLRSVVFQATMTKDGPTWRVARITRPQTC